MSYNFNTAPYYDDYDADNRFLKILFQPGRAVQARELTQVQSILQNQLSASANHIWKNGASVVGTEVSLNKRDYIILANADSSWIGRAVEGETSGAKALIEQLHEDESNPIYYVRLLSGTFLTTENIRTFDDDCVGGANGNVCPTNSWFVLGSIHKADTMTSNGQALEAKVGNGVYWIDNSFVKVLEQTIFLDDVGSVPTCKVGFDIVESLVTSSMDPTLLDPASGFFNHNAPGADRYQVTLKLIKESDSSDSNKFIWVMDIDAGVVTTEYERSDYNLLSDEIARRTYDESGDYTLNPFPLELKEHSLDAEKFTVKLEPSKAYIGGYEHELLVPLELEATRARTTKLVNNDVVYPEFGPYFEVESVNDLTGIFDVLHKEEVKFVTNEGYLASTVAPTIVGPTVRISHITKFGTQFRIYLENDEAMDSIASARYIVSVNDAGVYAKLYRPTGSAVKKGVNYPWIYKLGDVVSSVVVNEVSYETQKNLSGTMSGETMSVPSAYGDLEFQNNGILYVYDQTSGEIIPESGTASTGPVWTAVYSGASVILTIEDAAGVTADIVNGHAIEILANMMMMSAGWRAQTLSTLADSVTLTNNQLILPHSVQNILSIADASGIDVTSSFDFVSGDTDTTRLSSVLTWNSIDVPTVGLYHIQYTAYTLGDITTSTFVSINSYTDQGVDYSEVGSYYGDINSEEYRLSDCLDFRVAESDYNDGTYLPLPGQPIQVDYNIYLPRRDKVTINRDGVFNIIEGFPSEEAVLPQHGDDEMVLYNLYVPAYTYDAKNINVAHVKNKRYTMQDIRKIDKRLENLEYYTSLNLLEQDTSSMQVTDSNGLDRYKNGMLVDPFHDHGIGDINNPEYFVSVFPEAGILTNPYEMDGLDFTGGLLTNVRKNNLTYTLDFSVVEGWISQQYGSSFINLNPYARKSWMGWISLTPSTDTWFESKYVPDVIVQNANNNAVLQQRVNYGTQTRWNAWQTTWTGWQDAGSRSNVTASSESRTSGDNFQWTSGTWSGRRSGITRQRTVWANFTTTNESWDQSQVRRTNQVRSGNRTHLETNDIRTEVNDLVLDRAAIEWMRSIPVTINGDKLKPNTEFHFQFDGVNVDTYVSNPITDAFGRLNAVFTIPSEENGIKFRTGSKVLEVRDSFESGQLTSQGISLFTSAGTLNTREKTILSTLENVTVEESIRDSRSFLDGGVRTVRRGGGTGGTVGRSRNVTEWYDPVAESFLVTDEAGGVFIDSIDLYFATKDHVESNPVRLEIRPMENGYPTENAMPMASVFVYPEFVNTSLDGSTPTTFKFADPIYLMNDTEYCFVAISDSLDYHIYISDLGETDLVTGNRISSQPYLGSMFTSQNNTTWSAQQNRDVKFNINKCVFDIDSVSSMQLNLKTFEGVKPITSFTPTFEPMLLQGTKLQTKAHIAGVSSEFEGIDMREDVVLESQVTLNGANTFDSNGASYTTSAMAYDVTFISNNSNISPVLNDERLSTIIQNNVVFEGATKIVVENGISSEVIDEKLQKGIYVSKPIKLANPAEDLIMWLSVQEVPNTSVKVFFDTGKIIPRYFSFVNNPNTVTHGDYNVTDFEGHVAYVYPAGLNNPELVITNNGSPNMVNWNGVVGSVTAGSGSNTHVSTVFADGNTKNTASKLYVSDISDINDILVDCWVSKYDLDGVTHDVTTGVVGTDFSNYEIGDIWFGTHDEDTDRKFWRKVFLPDGTFGREAVPMLRIDPTTNSGAGGEAVWEEDAVLWREFQDSGVTITNPTVDIDMEFIEHTFIPLNKIINEFESFRIKIELHTTNPCYLPAVRELRVLALT